MASLTDFLTDLPNRRFLTQQLEQHWHDAGRQKQALSFLLIDVDRFKLVNDRFGHAVGDDVLKYLGASLKRWKREGDTVCRYGGEEFAVLLPGTDSQQALELGEQLRMSIEADSINRPAVLTEPVTISIGVASRVDQMPDAKELMGLADLCSIKRRIPAAIGRASAINEICNAILGTTNSDKSTLLDRLCALPLGAR